MFLPKENKILEKVDSNLFIIIYELFKVSLLTYFFILILEIFEPGFVTSYFNINIILYILIFTGLFVAFFSKKIEQEKTKNNNIIISLLMYVVVCIAASFMVYYQIKEIGDYSKIISIIFGIIIFLIAYSINNNNQEDN